MARLTLSVLTALALSLALGCSANAPVRHPARAAPARLAASTLTGVWVGSLRDRPTPGIHREVRVVSLLLAHPTTGKVTGSFSLLGAISTARQELLACSRKTRAQLRLTASISGGRFDSRMARFTLAEQTWAGDKSCGFHFPLGSSCAAIPGAAGTLKVRCGALALDLRRTSLTGVWTWGEERTDPAGDSFASRQRIHLVQRGKTLEGLLFETLTHRSNDGQRYRCNGRLAYVQRARYRLAGSLAGLSVNLRVVSTLRSKTPCARTTTPPRKLVGAWKPMDDRLDLSQNPSGHELRRLPRLTPVLPPERPRPHQR